MNYRSNYDTDKLSILGFGLMRLPKKGNSFDMDEIEREIVYSIENGVNYFDTAYIYPGSEEVFGTVLCKTGLRDKINIASKMPHYLIKSTGDMEYRFKEQLERLHTDRIDYYLMHMLPDVKTWDSLCDKGIAKWLEEKKSTGAIRKIGFSYHGSSEMFIKLLNAYPWDFCQIQYNYMDEHSQAGRAGLNEAARLNIPVIIMEPLRGGRLVNGLPQKAAAAFAASERKWSPAEWGFRWLWDQPAVSVVLSGMNSMKMIKENIRVASDSVPGMLNDSDKAVYDNVKSIINAKMKVPCTGCGYCMPCPKGVDIPGSFRCYNESYTDSLFIGIKEYFMCTTFKNEKSRVSQCAECGKCEQHCPQGIKIRQELKHVKKRLEFPLYDFVTKLIPGKIK